MTTKIANVKRSIAFGGSDSEIITRVVTQGKTPGNYEDAVRYDRTSVKYKIGPIGRKQPTINTGGLGPLRQIEVYAQGGSYSGVSEKLVKMIDDNDLDEEGYYTLTIDDLKTFAQGTSPVNFRFINRDFRTSVFLYVQFGKENVIDLVNFTDNDITFKISEENKGTIPLFLVANPRGRINLESSVIVPAKDIVFRRAYPFNVATQNAPTPSDYIITVTLDELLEFIPENENSQSFFFTYNFASGQWNNFRRFDRSPDGGLRPRAILYFTVDLDRPPPVSYKIASAPSSISEGKRQKISVSTVSVPNGTELYWTLNDSNNDFAKSSGSFIITNNKGEFFITASEDLLAEGNEVFDLLIRTDSIEGEIVEETKISITDTSDLGPTPEPEPSPFPTPTPDPSLEITTVLEAIKNELSGIKTNTSAITASLGTVAASSEASSAVDITPLVTQLTSIAEDITALRNLADTTGIRTTSPYEYVGNSVLYSLYVKQAQILNEEDASDEKQQEALQKFLNVSQEMLTNFNPDNGLSTGDFDLDNTNEDL